MNLVFTVCIPHHPWCTDGPCWCRHFLVPACCFCYDFFSDIQKWSHCMR